MASFAIPAWAASASDWISSYGPIGWVGAGFIGLIIGVFAIKALTAIKIAMININITKKFYENGDKINPLDKHFLNIRIHLRDLLPPGPGIIEGKTFENCELIGPLNIFPFQCAISGNLYTAVDYIVVDNQKAIDGKILNSAIFKDCRFLNCKIFFVSFLVMENSFEVFDATGGCNWITGTPRDKEQLSLGIENAEIGTDQSRNS